MSAQAHVDAVKALIGSGVRLFEGERPETSPLPCAVLFMDNGTSARTNLCPISDRRDVSFQVTSVALDGTGARSVAERIRTSVLDKRPVIAGRRTWRVVQDAAEPLRVDRDVTPHLLYVVDVYSFSSIPAV